MSDSEFRFNPDLLRDYSAAALQNAGELLEEATQLCASGHAARAYFLSVAAIEEAGKALQAFDARGRDLSDSAINTTIRRAMEDHSKKIVAALSVMLLASPNLRDDVMPSAALMVDLKLGREPSMYTDIRYDSSKIQIPSTVVSTTAAHECVRLARD